MKNLSYLAMLIVILGLILLVGCDGESNNPVQAPHTNQNEIISLAKSENHGPSASGQGILTYGGNGPGRIITFHAVMNADGSVSGKGVLVKVSSNPDYRQQLHFDIDCLNVDGNVAIMSGTITKAVRSMPGDPVWAGRLFQFKVVDNGEGANADPDEITHMDNWEPGDPNIRTCEEDMPWGTMPIEAGNIQVRQ
jgi:hypothetical protein